jgi:hypothetical protein
VRVRTFMRGHERLLRSSVVSWSDNHVADRPHAAYLVTHSNPLCSAILAGAVLCEAPCLYEVVAPIVAGRDYLGKRFA